MTPADEVLADLLKSIGQYRAQLAQRMAKNPPTLQELYDDLELTLECWLTIDEDEEGEEF